MTVSVDGLILGLVPEVSIDGFSEPQSMFHTRHATTVRGSADYRHGRGGVPGVVYKVVYREGRSGMYN